MEVIKELCAFLPKVNPRGVWGEFGMRDYLSIDTWEVTERVANVDESFIDFHVNGTRGSLPGRFIVRTDWTAEKVKGIYVESIQGLNEYQRKRVALLFDLTFTPDMASRLARVKPPMTHPDAGSW